MFKYIAEILAQFSRPQKILALLLVLFSVMTISIAPSLISALTVDCEELKIQVERQNKRIISLESLVDTLDFKIRTNQRECTNEITAREVEFLNMLEELKRDAKKSERTSNYTYESIRKVDVYTQDTIMVLGSMPEPAPIQVKPKKNPSMKGMVDKIEKMQSKIKNDN